MTNWSSQNGTPGSDDYAGATNAAFVPADQDFSGCLEVQKTTSTLKVRSFTQTPMAPGCYLQIKARVKLVSGAFPLVSIAGWAAQGTNQQLNGVVTTGPATQLTTYGEVVEISAIVGSGNRGGVDLVWGKNAIYGHFGIDLTGPNGGIVRIDDITIEDVSGAFVDQLIGAVDVRDFGAIGDGTTDDHDAFEAAELKDFNLPSYIDAFGDEVEAFKKAFQSLLNFNDHESLDMGGGSG